ncbi:restriction endonuclease subunit S [Kaistella sp. G5-32]|uniref:Restriction endonuclease subunit S n=1 Tax=Kaistella gelatinilytica TaxID=2787636 RepID=A0ABS0FBW9_9FLAO|nr:restriction endonuclease subunit S [Kaistella gelatinilytica]MBF8457142.1 restriction endonuclease subunit S [Kaistella gelatinilytica]
MGVNVIRKRLSDFRSEESLRYDYKYITSFVSSNQDFYTYRNLFDFVPYEKVNIDQLDSFKYAEIGNVNKLGEVMPVQLFFEDRQEENESLYKKIEKGDIIKPKKGDILISKIRPYLNKNVLVKSEDIYFTKAFIQIRPKINAELLHIAIRSKFINLLNAVSRQGKGYPTLKEDDIKAIRFPKTFVDVLIKNETVLLKKIQPCNREILELKVNRKSTLDILNDVFSSHYKINLAEVQKIDKTKMLSIPLSNVSNYNAGLRGSFRWNKMQYIQDIIYSKIDCIETLGTFIQSTKNGWSPLSVEGGEGVQVLGQEHFSSNIILKIEPSKSTEQTRNNIEDFLIKKGDFFVSRGNTVDLVALASIVEEEIEEDIIYPDLYIKLEFDESKVDKKYLAFLFNSFIGRLYFKYVAKGKNQTMVKVSSAELLNFRIPIPSKEQQVIIVEAIKTQLDSQKEIDRKIQEKQQAINKIIEDAIKNEQI